MNLEKKISIKLNGKPLKASIGCSISNLLKEHPHKGKFPAIGAIINKNRLDGLYYQLKINADIQTIDLSVRQGMDIYRRTATFILCAALYELNPKVHVVVGQSISDNYFFEIEGQRFTPSLIKRLEQRMREIVEAKLSLRREWTIIEEAIQLIKNSGHEDKIPLLQQYKRSEIPVVSIRGYKEIAYGPVAHTTATIDRFKLHSYEHGLLLGFPNSKGVVDKKISLQPKLFKTYVETKDWYDLMGASTIAQLNEHCIKGSISDLIKVAEALHERKIADIADDIARKKDCHLILIAGPSGSGKTTFSKRLAIQLKLHGIDPVSLSMDNYYVDREKTPKHEDGSYNFECLGALDINFLNKHLKLILSGQKVLLPKYNFSLGIREPVKKTEARLKDNQVIIMEGIHGLNEKLSSTVAKKNKYKIYVSALTQLSIDNHNRIFTSDTRLIRRIVRDRLFRGASVSDTLAVWPSVKMGEEKYIFSYQENADVIFNSALAYEPALLKPFAERFLMEVRRGDHGFIEASRLLRFFNFIVPILAREVPHISILREFIGGSAFRY